MKKGVTVKIPKIFIFIVGFFFIAIILKLSFIALSNNIDGINLKTFANNRNTKKDTIYAKRGNILDKDGNILASTVNSYTIIAYLDARRTKDESNPQHVVDKEKTAKMLNEMVGIDYNHAIEQLNKKNVYQVEFIGGKDISENLKNKIESLEMPGIDFIKGQKRTYSMGSFASYIVGYAKKNEDGDIMGELGIESYYDKELSGVNGSKTYQTDAYGYTLPGAEVVETKATDGDDIYLTIDDDIQLFAETLTHNLSKNYKMDWMIFTVMDAKTGAIVASSTYPNFDPNNLSSLSNFMNPLVSYEYEPGSVMKTFSFAASIEEGLYDGSKTYMSGSIPVADAIIRDFNRKGWGEISFDTGFAYSSNVAASILGLELKAERLTNYYKKLGFSQKTGIELAKEVSGKVQMQYLTEIANASFGQGITVTPIQMMQALSALTNDGTIIKPYIVSKIVNDNDEVIYEGGRTEVAKVYSKETMDYMRKLMHNVVYEGLTSSHIWQPSKVNMIGKTGTAQIASPNGGYLHGDYDYIRSFAGIFPEEDPKYIIYVAVKQLNASSASPIAKEVTKAVDDIVSYLGIENTSNTLESKIINLNNYISEEVIKTKEELEKHNLKVITMGSGKYIINQYPLKNTQVFAGDKVFLVSNNNDYILEDMLGWSLNDVKTYASLLNININVTGYGYVTKQDIPSGTSINSDSIINVVLSK